MSFKEKINLEQIPKHIAIIMDGNGRWAQKKGKFRVFGHQHGVAPVKACAEAAVEIGVEFLTLYAFSKENWNRPVDEVNALMSLLVKTIHSEIETLQKNKIRLKAIGDLSSLPKETLDELNNAINETSKNTKMTMILALSYGSQWEIIEAVKSICKEHSEGNLKIDEIDENTISSHLTTKDYPNPELLIRTSGELRISNFLLWQIAYSELYFTKKLWPDFTKEDLYKAILDYQQRERRFGKTSDQINV
jgi:undecaprenyl diphosphate synthase